MKKLILHSLFYLFTLHTFAQISGWEKIDTPKEKEEIFSSSGQFTYPLNTWFYHNYGFLRVDSKGFYWQLSSDKLNKIKNSEIIESFVIPEQYRSNWNYGNINIGPDDIVAFRVYPDNVNKVHLGILDNGELTFTEITGYGGFQDYITQTEKYIVDRGYIYDKSKKKLIPLSEKTNHWRWLFKGKFTDGTGFVFSGEEDRYDQLVIYPYAFTDKSQKWEKLVDDKIRASVYNGSNDITFLTKNHRRNIYRFGSEGFRTYTIPSDAGDFRSIFYLNTTDVFIIYEGGVVTISGNELKFKSFDPIPRNYNYTQHGTCSWHQDTVFIQDNGIIQIVAGDRSEKAHFLTFQDGEFELNTTTELPDGGRCAFYKELNGDYYVYSFDAREKQSGSVLPLRIERNSDFKEWVPVPEDFSFSWNMSVTEDFVYFQYSDFKFNRAVIMNTTTAMQPENIKIYPNPSADYVTVTGKGVAKVEFYNTSGELVKTSQSDSSFVGDLIPGQYTIKAYTQADALINTGRFSIVR